LEEIIRNYPRIIFLSNSINTNFLEKIILIIFNFFPNHTTRGRAIFFPNFILRFNLKVLLGKKLEEIRRNYPRIKVIVKLEKHLFSGKIILIIIISFLTTRPKVERF